MKKFKLEKLVLAITILISGTMGFHKLDVQASTLEAKIAYSTYMYKSPSSKAKKIIKVKNNTKVVCYSINTHGWAHVKYNSKKGYINSLNLNILKEQKISYVMHPKGIYKYYNSNNPTLGAPKGYTYMWTNGETSTPYLKYVNPKSFVWYENKKLYQPDSHGKNQYLYVVNKYGIAIYPVQAEGMQLLNYPVINNRKFYTMGAIAQTHILKKPVKIKAGTFENVVREDYMYNRKIYFAPNVGVIKITDNGETTRELVSLDRRP